MSDDGGLEELEEFFFSRATSSSSTRTRSSRVFMTSIAIGRSLIPDGSMSLCSAIPYCMAYLYNDRCPYLLAIFRAFLAPRDGYGQVLAISFVRHLNRSVGPTISNLRVSTSLYILLECFSDTDLRSFYRFTYKVRDLWKPLIISQQASPLQ